MSRKAKNISVSVSMHSVFEFLGAVGVKHGLSYFFKIYFCPYTVLLGCDRTLRLNHIMVAYRSSHDFVNIDLGKLGITPHPSLPVDFSLIMSVLGSGLLKLSPNSSSYHHFSFSPVFYAYYSHTTLKM